MKKYWTVVFAVLFMYSSHLVALTPDDVGVYLKQSVARMTEKEINGMMRHHVAQMRLLTSSGQWIHPAFQAIETKILPKGTNVKTLQEFIDTVVRVNKKNDYLMAFFREASKTRFLDLERKLKTEGYRVLPSVITFAYVLNNLTRLMRNDWRLLAVLTKAYPALRTRLNLSKHLSLVERVKVSAVERPIKAIVTYHHSGDLDKNFLKHMLPLNIYWAVALDYKRGNWDNAWTGRVLAWYKPNGGHAKKLRHLPMARWSDDGRAIWLGLPLSRQWADLYSTWNMGFVSHYKYFPYILPKLVMPQVADHYENSDEYIYNRGIALYLYLHYTYFGRLDGRRYLANHMDWSSLSLTRLWGKVNRQSALQYDRELKQQIKMKRKQ